MNNLPLFILTPASSVPLSPPVASPGISKGLTALPLQGGRDLSVWRRGLLHKSDWNHFPPHFRKSLDRKRDSALIGGFLPFLSLETEGFLPSNLSKWLSHKEQCPHLSAFVSSAAFFSVTSFFPLSVLWVGGFFLKSHHWKFLLCYIVQNLEARHWFGLKMLSFKYNYLWGIWSNEIVTLEYELAPELGFSSNIQLRQLNWR